MMTHKVSMMVGILRVRGGSSVIQKVREIVEGYSPRARR